MLEGLFSRARRRFRRARYATAWVDDLPDDPHPNIMYVVGGRLHPHRIVMRCPNRKCSHLVYLDVFEDADPGWSLREHHDGSLSLMPSVFLPGLPCRSHYWVRMGEIFWVPHPWYRYLPWSPR